MWEEILRPASTPCARSCRGDRAYGHRRRRAPRSKGKSSPPQGEQRTPLFSSLLGSFRASRPPFLPSSRGLGRAVAPRPILEGPRHPGPFFLRFPPPSVRGPIPRGSALLFRTASTPHHRELAPRPSGGPLRPSQNRDHVTKLLRAPRPGPHILIPALHCGPRRPEAPGRIRVRRRCPARWAPILVSARVGRQGPARGSAQFPGHNSAGRTDLQRREAPAGSEPGPCRA